DYFCLIWHNNGWVF
nr:immunoglobulin light chain junction region [Macaca mulatta]